MKLSLIRYFRDENSTDSILLLDGEYFCSVVENPWMDNQRSISSIPDGSYVVKKLEMVTPLTEKYRERFSWFDYHFEITDVADRHGIYLHIGNTSSDVSGCLAVGTHPVKKNFVSNSIKTFTRLYEILSKEPYHTIRIKTIEPF